MDEVEELITEAEQNTMQTKEGNVEELDKRIADEQEKVVALIEKISTSETLIRSTTPAKEALDEASKIKKKFDISVQRLDEFKAYQETLKVQGSDIPELAEFEKQYSIRYNLWNIRQTFGAQ